MALGCDLVQLLGAEVGGQLFAQPGKAAVGHIAEGKGLARVLGEIAQPFSHGGRGGQVGIAQAEIVDIFRAEARLELAAGFEHAADP